MFVVLVCVVALLLPLKGTLDASSHPLLAYFSLSHKLKLVAAYILASVLQRTLGRSRKFRFRNPADTFLRIPSDVEGAGNRAAAEHFKRANKVPLCGRILQQKALEFACMLSHDNFKASPGWLSLFKARHDIVAKVISGRQQPSTR
ncbi:hypothetical protein HPB51_001380 [Rhipicephalus microplus]|uniref:HTH CENPB-type domain-containing protein n=1 Tax=Rhipicephalus microplus TaxID=6941 RepID=A0A9J6EF98_RHIMP|nr:hypothetical protein HPB51_001380 [Rhipicephalus microplus]